MLKLVVPALAAGSLLLPAYALAQTGSPSSGQANPPTSAEQQDMHRGSITTNGSSNTPATMPSGNTKSTSSATSPSAQSDTSATTSDTTTTKKHRKHKSQTTTTPSDQTTTTPAPAPRY